MTTLHVPMTDVGGLKTLQELENLVKLPILGKRGSRFLGKLARARL